MSSLGRVKRVGAGQGVLMEWVHLLLMYALGINTGLGLALVIDWWRGR